MFWEKIVLGCGNQHYPGALHIDILKTKAVDKIFDLNKCPWPLPDECTDEVIAEDIIEHLQNIVLTMEEIHRILCPNKPVYIQTPHKDHPNSWHDPTHIWHLTEHSFDYFDPTTPFGIKYNFYTKKKFKILSNETVKGNINIKMIKLVEK